MAHAGVVPAAGRGYLERARALIHRVEAHGGRLVSWSAVTLAFAWPESAIDDVVLLVAHMATEGTSAGEIGWAIGVAQGKLEALGDSGPRKDLAWGIALTSAVSLVRIAKPSEVLIDASVRALVSGELIALGYRVGKDKGKRLRGAKLDVRQPFRREAAEQASRMTEPSYILAADDSTGVVDPSALLWMPGALAILRADPGTGGTRMLAELSRLVMPGRSLLISPVGSGMQPLGALRRAIARATSVEVHPFLLDLAPALDALVGGDGISIDTAAKLVAAFLWPRNTAAPPGALLIDDAREVDAASLEACSRAVAVSERAFAVVARLDATDSPPTTLAGLAKGPEVELKPLGLDRARSLAAACTQGAMNEEARRRWARRGGFTPLGILEAIACSLEAGDLAWVGDKVFPRTRTAGKGKPHSARHFVQKRAELVSDGARMALMAIAFLGGEAKLAHLAQVFEGMGGGTIDIGQLVQDLARNRWLASHQKGWVALPTHTHRDALVDMANEAQRLKMHGVISDVLSREDRGLGQAEAAYHAGLAGDAPRAARHALAAAHAASECGLEQWAAQLIGFAKKHDPSCEAEAQRVLASSIPASRLSAIPQMGVVERSELEGAAAADRAVSPAAPLVAPVEPGAATDAPPVSRTLVDERPPAVSVPQPSAAQSKVDTPAAETMRDGPDSEPPTMQNEIMAPLAPPSIPKVAAAPASAGTPVRAPTRDVLVVEKPVAGQRTESVALKLTSLAREALLGADFSALEQWVEGLRATGERAAFTDRMRAMARLSRGDVGDALRVLRRSRAALPPGALGARCQASLALGIALAVAGRPQDALLEGLEALARAREAKDARGTAACLKFLSKLYAGVDRRVEADRLREIAAPAK